MPRVTAAASVLLFGLVAVVVTEALLLALLVIFSSILGISLDIQLGPENVVLQQWRCCEPVVVVFNAATVGSVLFTAGCGVGAAMSKFQRWRALG